MTCSLGDYFCVCLPQHNVSSPEVDVDIFHFRIPVPSVDGTEPIEVLGSGGGSGQDPGQLRGGSAGAGAAEVL